MRILSIASVCVCAGLAGSALAQLASPGFELGPNQAVTSFPQSPNSMSWRASNTDGERIVTTFLKPAFEGQYYASLLQNAGAYAGQPLGFGSFGFTGFDRIYDTFAVTPNTIYLVTFMHAGDDRFGYVAGNTIVEVGAADNSAMFSQFSTPTPGLFAWTSFSFQFTTNATTTLAAIGFTTNATYNSSVVLDKIEIRVIPAPGVAVLLPALGFALSRRRRGL